MESYGCVDLARGRAALPGHRVGLVDEHVVAAGFFRDCRKVVCGRVFGAERVGHNLLWLHPGVEGVRSSTIYNPGPVFARVKLISV